MNEIFPIEFIVDRRRVWLGWMSVDEPADPFLKKNGFLIWSPSQEGLIEKCNDFFAEISIMESSVFDIDSILERLCQGARPSCDDLINLWNILLDIEISSGVNKEKSALLNENSIDAYDRFFSGTTAAKMIDQCRDFALPSDFHEVARIILLGKKIILRMINSESG